MKRDVKLYLNDITESIAKIEEYTKSVTKEKFSKDVKLQDAVMRRLEIIGEAAKNVPDDFRKKASFCGLDCLEYFLIKIRQIKQGAGKTRFSGTNSIGDKNAEKIE